jgi:multidrug efflux pump
LLVSWVVAVLFTPYLGYKLLPDYATLDPRKTLTQRLLLSPLRRVFPRLIPPPPSPEHAHEHDVYNRGFYRRFRAAVTWCVTWRKTVIGITLAIFALAIVGFGFVQQQFFPSSDRAELVIDWNLPQNASIAETDAQIARFEREQLQGNPAVDRQRRLQRRRSRHHEMLKRSQRVGLPQHPIERPRVDDVDSASPPPPRQPGQSGGKGLPENR